MAKPFSAAPWNSAHQRNWKVAGPVCVVKGGWFRAIEWQLCHSASPGSILMKDGCVVAESILVKDSCAMAESVLAKDSCATAKSMLAVNDCVRAEGILV